MERLSGMRVAVNAGQSLSVLVSMVHIVLERQYLDESPERDSWTFHPDTLAQLERASRKKADMVLVDYIYIDGVVSKYFAERSTHTKISEAELKRRILNPSHLRDWVASHDGVERKIQARILENLFLLEGAVYLHTYTPQGAHVATGSMEQRRRMAGVAFPNGRIDVIDTRSELYNNEEFDWPNPDSKFCSRYYPYQLAVLFAQIVQTEMLRSVVDRVTPHRKVFIVHERGSDERNEVASLMRDLSLEAVILDDQPNVGSTILAKLRHYADVGFAVVVLTGKDRGGFAGDGPNGQRPRARQNAIFELGFFLALLGDKRVCCLCTPNIELPTNYRGPLYLELDKEGEWKKSLAREISAAGLGIDPGWVERESPERVEE
ncbi:hypothetical protein Hhel01_02669 [Haloferula helveola]